MSENKGAPTKEDIDAMYERAVSESGGNERALRFAFVREVLADFGRTLGMTEGELSAAPAPVEQDERGEEAAFKHWLFNVAPKDTYVGAAWAAWQARASLAAPASATGHAALIGEALAVFDLMLDGCNDQEFGDFQNGHGETIGPLMDALHAKLRAAVSGRAPSVPGGESESVDTPDLRELIGDVYRAGSYNESIEASEKALIAHVARQVRAARDQAAQWISVDERLPEGECLAVYVTPNGKQRLIRAKYAQKFQIESEGDDCETEYNEEDDTFYIKAGWLECIDNWGEYSSCYVVEGVVTHWTPLPSAPQEPASTGKGAK